MDKRHSDIKTYIRALRLPFITASVFPFILGSLISRQNFHWLAFVFGLFCAVFTHLGANLINDYADSKSGADWKDRRFFNFFGGSKLIQEGILSEGFYLKLSMLCFLVACVSIVLVAYIIRNFSVLAYFFVILCLGFSYSHKPLAFSYHRLGELIIFILFGPAVVMGAHFIQAQKFPTLEGFLLSLPFGFFTTAILFANEVPDFNEDKGAGKFTWVGLIGQGNAYVIYYVLALLGFVSIALNIIMGYLGFISCISFVFMFLSIKAGDILKRSPQDKLRLMESSQLTILTQALVSISLILGRIIL